MEERVVGTMEPVEIHNAPPQEVVEVVEEVKPAPKKRTRKKTDAPSDRTVIKNLKAEVAELHAQLDTARRDIEIQANKADIYFMKWKDLAEKERKNEELFSEAKNNLFKGLSASIQAFDMITR